MKAKWPQGIYACGGFAFLHLRETFFAECMADGKKTKIFARQTR